MPKTESERELVVLKELEEFIVPLSKDEFSQLEQNLLTDGCKEPLTVWPRNGKLILADGHNRYRICTRHSIPFRIRKIEFKDMEQLKVWMLDNQMGRRNLTPDQLSYYRGLKYLSLRRNRGGYENVQSKGKKGTLASEVLSDKFNVSESTIKRDARYAEGLNIINRSNPKLKARILAGDAKIKKTDVQTLVDAPNSDKIVIRNEADLFNKASNIRSEIMEVAENHVKALKKERLERAQKLLEESEPMFLSKEENLKKVKASIVSVINRAIRDQDTDAIKELRALVNKLEGMLSGK